MSGGATVGDAGWQDAELTCAGLPDKRLARRLGRLLDQLCPHRVSRCQLWSGYAAPGLGV